MNSRTCIVDGCDRNIYRRKRCSEHFYQERNRLRGPLDDHQRELLAARQAYWEWDDTRFLHVCGLILDRQVKSIADLTAREADKVTSRIPGET